MATGGNEGTWSSPWGFNSSISHSKVDDDSQPGLSHESPQPESEGQTCGGGTQFVCSTFTHSYSVPDTTKIKAPPPRKWSDPTCSGQGAALAKLRICESEGGEKGGEGPNPAKPLIHDEPPLPHRQEPIGHPNVDELPTPPQNQNLQKQQNADPAQNQDPLIQNKQQQGPDQQPPCGQEEAPHQQPPDRQNHVAPHQQLPEGQNPVIQQPPEGQNQVAQQPPEGQNQAVPDQQPPGEQEQPQPEHHPDGQDQGAVADQPVNQDPPQQDDPPPPGANQDQEEEDPENRTFEFDVHIDRTHFHGTTRGASKTTLQKGDATFTLEK